MSIIRFQNLFLYVQGKRYVIFEQGYMTVT